MGGVSGTGFMEARVASARGGGWCGVVLKTLSGDGSACVFVFMLVSRMSVPCAHGGPVPRAHRCSQPCASLSCLILPLPGSCLEGCWPSHCLVSSPWPY